MEGLEHQRGNESTEGLTSEPGEQPAPEQAEGVDHDADQATIDRQKQAARDADRERLAAEHE